MFSSLSNTFVERPGRSILLIRVKTNNRVYIQSLLSDRLSYFMQLLLLQESWKDLFILHLSQWAIPWDLSDLLMNRQTQLRKEGNILPSEDEIIDMEIKSMQVSTFFIHVYVCAPFICILIWFQSYTLNFQEIMSRFRQIFPDGTECGCLKTIVLFKPGNIPCF